ncbi:mandelate racemase/muconate lactonizing enzyme family protein [Caulobacter sp. X]|uniref:mandelate racemase/muconate lactonizing enzyme family protein n=1 Tax=Caulobacter sp. X TaxID=2048901 RepID=UPI000C14CEEC|nr:mandelate racemase/muconate lactonizing enzyme family protein [Caulobacter sp. X]PIB95237.1 galactonate dehydratase [Caulobacter sp. X]
MKITAVTAYPVWAGHRNLCLVKVETDEGLFGWGESGLSSREQAVAAMVGHFREFLIGKDARNIGALWQEMYRGQYFEGGRTITAAISAIDIALWDIAGKALGVPIHRLLGGAQRDRIPCFITSTAAHGEAMIADMVALKSRGWDCIRATVGEAKPSGHIYDPRQAIAQAAGALVEARQELGSAVTLGIDFHHRLQVAEAASFCQRMPSGTLDFLEEPIRQQCPGAYRTLRDMTAVPFAIGEEFASKWDFLPYIEGGLTNFARVDICNVGGFTEAMKIAAMAEAHYIDLMPHDPLGPICTMATIHMSAAAPNLAWQEVDPYGLDMTDYDRMFPDRPQLDGASFAVPQAPGLGLTVDEDAVAAAHFAYWEPPRRYKPDGSYTNW